MLGGKARRGPIEAEIFCHGPWVGRGPWGSNAFFSLTARCGPTRGPCGRVPMSSDPGARSAWHEAMRDCWWAWALVRQAAWRWPRPGRWVRAATGATHPYSTIRILVSSRHTRTHSPCRWYVIEQHVCACASFDWARSRLDTSVGRSKQHTRSPRRARQSGWGTEDEERDGGCAAGQSWKMDEA